MATREIAPFLRPEQEEVLNPINSEGAETPGSLTSVPDALLLLRSTLSEGMNAMELHATRKDNPYDPNSVEGITFQLQDMVGNYFYMQRTHTLVQFHLEGFTADTFVRSGEASAAQGYRLGEELIDRRMRIAATAILVTATTLRHPYTNIGETESTWGRARNAHARSSKIRPKVRIDEEEGDVFAELLDRAQVYADGVTELIPEPPFRPSKFKAVNVLRLAKNYKKLKDEYGLTGIKTMLDGVEAVLKSLPTPYMTLSPEEVHAALKTGGKQASFLKTARMIDASIATDPKANAMIFVADNYKSMNEANEKQHFLRRVNQLVRQKQREE